MYYKCLDIGRRPIFAAARLPWPDVGTWTPDSREVIMCSAGWHLTDRYGLMDFLGPLMYRAEGDYTKPFQVGKDKSVFTSARLTSHLSHWNYRSLMLVFSRCIGTIYHRRGYLAFPWSHMHRLHKLRELMKAVGERNYAIGAFMGKTHQLFNGGKIWGRIADLHTDFTVPGRSLVDSVTYLLMDLNRRPDGGEYVHRDDIRFVFRSELIRVLDLN